MNLYIESGQPFLTCSVLCYITPMWYDLYNDIKDCFYQITTNKYYYSYLFTGGRTR